MGGPPMSSAEKHGRAAPATKKGAQPETQDDSSADYRVSLTILIRRLNLGVPVARRREPTLAASPADRYISPRSNPSRSTSHAQRPASLHRRRGGPRSFGCRPE